MNSDSHTDHSLTGVWKLLHFQEVGKSIKDNFTDILIFCGKYYSDFQVERGQGTRVVSHVGIYKTSEDGITFQIQLSNLPEMIGRVTTGNYAIHDEQLVITMTFGTRPGTWVYTRLE